jgi:hypothetical protein
MSSYRADILGLRRLDRLVGFIIALCTIKWKMSKW